VIFIFVAEQLFTRGEDFRVFISEKIHFSFFLIKRLCHSKSLFNASMGAREFTSKPLSSSNRGLVSGKSAACWAA
jgi:hypothetical protein